jgi:hypothetical protein
MKYLPELFNANARWAEDMRAADPNFFTSLADPPEPCLPVDRLLRQPRASQPDHRPEAG